MSRNIENHDSVLLLQDCIAGCKMALESMDDIREHTDDKQLRELIDKYYDEHTGLSVDCRDMLDKAGADIKEPGVFAKMAAKLQTAMKMAVNDDQSQSFERCEQSRSRTNHDIDFTFFDTFHLIITLSL